MQLIKNHKIFCLVFLTVIAIGFYRQSKEIIQQDNYVGYAHYLSTDFSGISYYDSRLYAGLPVLIVIFNFILKNSQISGTIISFLFFAGSYAVLYKLTKNKYSFIPLIFPPVMLSQATKIATEYPALFLFLLSIYFLKNKKLRLSFLTLGMTIWFRHNIVPLFPVYFFINAKNNGLKLAIFQSLSFFLPIILYAYFNAVVLETGNPLYPYTTYLSIETQRYVIGIFQLVKDVFIAIAEKEWRILFSGSAYMLLIIFLIIKSYKKINLKKNIFLTNLFVLIIFYLIFNLSLGYKPFLQEYARYMVPVFPLFWLILVGKNNNKFITFILLFISAAVVLI